MQQELSRATLAKKYFLEGYNCTQAVVLAFADLFEIDQNALLSIASSFGGGMGRLREVCGTVSGMFIVMGLISGYCTPETGKVKADHYAHIQNLARCFEAQNGSIVCRELLKLDNKRDLPIPEARTAEYYKKRPCPELVKNAAQILDTYLSQNNILTKK